MVPEAANDIIITAYNKNIYAPTPVWTGPPVARNIDILFRAPGEYVIKADFVETICHTSAELEIIVPEEEQDPDPVLTLSVSPSTDKFNTGQTYRFTTTMTPNEFGRAVEMIAYNKNNPSQAPMITRFPNNDRMINVSFTHEGEYLIKANFANATSENTSVEMTVIVQQDPDPVLTLSVSPSTDEFKTDQTYRFTTSLTPNQPERSIIMMAYNKNFPDKDPLIVSFPGNDRIIDISFRYPGYYVIKANFANATSESTAAEIRVTVKKKWL